MGEGGSRREYKGEGREVPGVFNKFGGKVGEVGKVGKVGKEGRVGKVG